MSLLASTPRIPDCKRTQSRPGFLPTRCREVYVLLQTMQNIACNIHAGRYLSRVQEAHRHAHRLKFCSKHASFC